MVSPSRMPTDEYAVSLRRAVDYGPGGIMSRERIVFFVASLMPVMAVAAFLLLSPLMSARATTAVCAPGECKKNGCTERSQYCNEEGTGWLPCGTC